MKTYTETNKDILDSWEQSQLARKMDAADRRSRFWRVYVPTGLTWLFCIIGIGWVLTH